MFNPLCGYAYRKKQLGSISTSYFNWANSAVFGKYISLAPIYQFDQSFKS